MNDAKVNFYRHDVNEYGILKRASVIKPRAARNSQTRNGNGFSSVKREGCIVIILQIEKKDRLSRRSMLLSAQILYTRIRDTRVASRNATPPSSLLPRLSAYRGAGCNEPSSEYSAISAFDRTSFPSRYPGRENRRNERSRRSRVGYWRAADARLANSAARSRIGGS